MTCRLHDDLAAREVLSGEDDLALVRHLESCPECRARGRHDARLADPLVAAAAAHGRLRRTVRRAGAAVVTASVLLAAVLAIRLARRPDPEVRYVIRGDSTGIVLTGPGIERRGETLPLPQRKEDRL